MSECKECKKLEEDLKCLSCSGSKDGCDQCNHQGSLLAYACQQTLFKRVAENRAHALEDRLLLAVVLLRGALPPHSDLCRCVVKDGIVQAVLDEGQEGVDDRICQVMDGMRVEP